MKFYVIYSFDVLDGESVKPLQPPNVKAWDLTETDESYDYDYLGPEYEKGKHRKYCRMMSKESFKRFIAGTFLIMEDIETMGSITDLGWMPAFAFRSEDEEFHIIQQGAYVTPIPEHPEGKEFTKAMTSKNWELIKKALLNMYG